MAGAMASIVLLDNNAGLEQGHFNAMADTDVIITDGSVDFSGGVDSQAVTTIQSSKNPNGLQRNQLSWLDNATLRDGGITCRSGFTQLATISDRNGHFQGKFMYSPIGSNPYEVFSISGHILIYNIDSGQLFDLTVAFSANVPQFNPSGDFQAHFVQGEQYLLIQAGDDTTLPFIWDGSTLRRSKGITNTLVAPGTPGVNEIPAAGPMDYFMGRIWYAQGRQVSAGDIVRGTSGTLANQFKDSILNVTENPMVLGGDGFTISSSDGNIIRGIRHSANIDAALGQGRLFVGTSKAIYALNVPVTRTDWIAANNNTQPLMTIVQLANGWVNDRSITPVNGDLFFQSLEPGIRSLMQAMRYFSMWGNIQISANETRILQFNNRELLRYSSGVYYDNRMLQTSLPERTDQGVVSHALIPMDFTPISSFNKERQPNWEGMYEGLDFFQLNTGDFGGRERCFATTRSKLDSSIQLWEYIAGTKFDNGSVNGEARITWSIEFPAFTWGDENLLKRLLGAELWIDRLTGVVQFSLQYRPDGQACWIDWHTWKKCSTKNTEENVYTPAAYPTNSCLESYFATMTMPKPPQNMCTATGRPSDIAYQFQPRLLVTGFCRLRGLYLHATSYGRKLYQNLTC